jgi:hypothetical protein
LLNIFLPSLDGLTVEEREPPTMATAHFTKEEAKLCKCKKNGEMQPAFPRNSFFSVRVRAL